MPAIQPDTGMHAMKCRPRSIYPLLLWLGLIFSPLAIAGDYALGMQALERGDTALAIKLWQPLAEAGNAEAQFALGVVYNDAIGVEQNYAEANYWLLRAAEQGYVMAQYNLGNAYKEGTGMAIDPAMAVIWWQKAAEQDFAPAQFNLGSALLEGLGTPRDREAGLAWYRRAAANRHPQAQLYLSAPTEAEPKDATPRDDSTPSSTIQAPSSQAIAANTAESSATQTTAPLEATDCTTWLNQDTNTHTVQLMASLKEADLHAYITQHTLTDTAICHYPVKGKFWYALLYGRHESAAEARGALAALPAEVRENGGYVRRIDEIRAAVKTRQD